ncbi:uncharacterized protein LOC117642451 [Thrips palmi]|uniref:Uncharacterized protein LOC117642451 n=1 Tax=Thrips palmi TaxID=161013 RepID=A0A6P8YHX0_THRPL|nr:uncharacterized protein LOC117642451 [Thrips palmi]
MTEENDNNTPNVKIRDINEMTQKPDSAFHCISPTFCNESSVTNEPLMQMLLNAHLAQRTSNSSETLRSEKIIVPVPRPTMADPNRIFLLQVKKLQKEPRQDNAQEAILPAPDSVAQCFKETLLVKEPESLQESQTYKVAPHAEKTPKHLTHVPSSVQPNDLNAGRRIFLLQVEKLQKESPHGSTNKDQFKENMTPDEKHCDPCNAAQPQEAPAFPAVSGPLLDVCPNEMPIQSASSIMSALKEDCPSRETTRNEEKISKQETSFSTVKKNPNTVSKRVKGCDQNIHKIRRLQTRVLSLENLLYKIIDEKLVPTGVIQTIRKTLRRGTKLF